MASTTINLPDDLHRRLKYRAADEKRAMNSIVIDAIEQYLSKEKNTQ